MIYPAITTEIRPATENAASYILVHCPPQRLRVPRAQDATSPPEEHIAAARDFAKKFGMSETLVTGVLPNGVYCHVTPN
jgi:hypothetical protein